MGRVTDIDSKRQHEWLKVECKDCEHEWVAVFPEGTEILECPGCHQSVNKYGVRVSKHVCAACKRPFTLTPAATSEEFGNECLADDCISYDPDRDAEIAMGFKEREPEH